MTLGHSLAVVLGVALSTGAVAACGADTVGDSPADPPTPDASTPDPSTPDPSTPDPSTPDVTPPTVLSMTPEDGATKLKHDVKIVVTFSEPMNKAATEGAFSIDTASKTSGPPEFSWNADGSILTIDPKALYTTGDDPATTTAVPLKFALYATATDLAGNALTAGASASVSLYRHITQEAARHADLFGNNCADSNVRKSFIGPGDCESDVERRGYVSFILPAMPAGAEIDKATLEGTVRETGTDMAGNAFEDFGDMHIEHVTFNAINMASFSAPALLDLGVLIEAVPAPLVGGAVAKDVTVAVKGDVASGRTLSQYRLLFKKNVPKADGKTEMAHIENGDGEVKIKLSYLIE